MIQYLVGELIIALWLLKQAVRLEVNAVECAVNMVNTTLLMAPAELNVPNTGISLTYCNSIKPQCKCFYATVKKRRQVDG